MDAKIKKRQYLRKYCVSKICTTSDAVIDRMRKISGVFGIFGHDFLRIDSIKKLKDKIIIKTSCKCVGNPSI